MDFGGYAENTDNKSLKGINDFKLAFGGQRGGMHQLSFSYLLYAEKTG